MSFLLTILVSTALGLLSGLGIGGGSLMILWLTLVCGMEFPQARYLNLLFFLPPALLTTAIRLIRKEISIKRILPAAIAGSLCAALLTNLSSGWDASTLRRLFGALLLLAAWKELGYKNNQSPSPK